MLLIVLLLVPLLPLLAYLSLRTPPGIPITSISKPKEIVSRIAIGLLFPGEWMLYRYLLPRQQTFLGMENLRIALYGLALAAALFLAWKATKQPRANRTGSLILSAVAAFAGILIVNVFYAWLCNLAFLLPGSPASRTFQLTTVHHDYGKGSSHTDTITGQMQGRTGLTTIRTYRFDGPDPNAALMPIGDHHACDLSGLQPNDTLMAKGHANLFGFAIERFEPANERLRSDCAHDANTDQP